MDSLNRQILATIGFGLYMKSIATLTAIIIVNACILAGCTSASEDVDDEQLWWQEYPEIYDRFTQLETEMELMETEMESMQEENLALNESLQSSVDQNLLLVQQFNSINDGKINPLLIVFRSECTSHNLGNNWFIAFNLSFMSLEDADNITIGARDIYLRQHNQAGADMIPHEYTITHLNRAEKGYYTSGVLFDNDGDVDAKWAPNLGNHVPGTTSLDGSVSSIMQQFTIEAMVDGIEYSNSVFKWCQVISDEGTINETEYVHGL